jgi:serine/threonine protein kinase
MPTPRKYFRSPFPSLILNNQLNHGAQAIILAFPQSIVLKCPIKWGFDDGFPVKSKKTAEIEEIVSAESMSIEKQMLSILRRDRHPNIIEAIMIVPEGIFMPRMRFTLEDRVICYRDLHYPECHATDELKLRWVTQIIGAASWLEYLGYAHGDLTPRNILLDHRDDIKLSDFGESVHLGEESQCGAPPYVPWVFEVRNHHSEQYAIGWTIYNLYMVIPDEFEGPQSVDAFAKIKFPIVDGLFIGPIIQQCWRLQYQSIAALDRDVSELLKKLYPWHKQLLESLRLSLGRFVDRFRRWIFTKNCKDIYHRLLLHSMCFILIMI